MKILISMLCTVLILGLLYFAVTPSGKRIWNNWFHEVQKADDDTNYKTKKEVENTCRAMIASYNSDKLKYEQYQTSEKENEKEWAEQAKMRANNTASTYNNYITQNNYVWKNNIPSDIFMTLEYLK